MPELTANLDSFLEPMLMHLPEKRLREVGKAGSARNAEWAVAFGHPNGARRQDDFCPRRSDCIDSSGTSNSAIVIC